MPHLVEGGIHAQQPPYCALILQICVQIVQGGGHAVLVQLVTKTSERHGLHR